MDASRGEENAGAIGAQGGPLETHCRRVQAGSAYALLEREDVPLAYWSTPDGRTLAGVGAVRDLVASDRTALANLESRAETLFGEITHDGPAEARPRVLGGRAFDETTPYDAMWEEFPLAWFFLPRLLVTETSGGAWATLTSPPGSPETMAVDLTVSPESAVGLAPEASPRIVDSTPRPAREDWMEQVSSLRTSIDDGAFTKVVLAHTRSIELDSPPSVAMLVRRLEATNPNCHVLAIQPREGVLFAAATPERLVRRDGRRVDTDALAGSVPRGDDPQSDSQLSASLEASRKDAHEHDLVVDAIARRLHAVGGSVDTGPRGVRQLQAVQHLHTPIQADVPESPHVLSLVDDLHPTPAVGGLPREAAVDAIRTIEDFDRGWYAAPIGWFDGGGNGDFAIGIRSAVFHERRARLFAGAGIVTDSEPSAEWDELQLKYRPMLDVFANR